MAVKNKKSLTVGALLALSFLGVLVLIFSPVFGGGRNGLVFSDDMFNKLSKGSSYFIPKVAEGAAKFVGAPVAAALKMETPAQADTAVQVLTAAGAQARAEGDTVKVGADLGRLMEQVLQDSDAMFKNQGRAVAARYGLDEKEVMVVWWNVLKVLDKHLKKEGKVEEAKIVTDVMKKAVETAHNFYGIEAVKVTEKAGLMSGLLLFYVAYTMWWGFAIYYLFEGFGLSTSKAKH